MHQQYDLLVRGEAVHIEFQRVNDSRRLRSFGSNKKPNLFGVRAVMECQTALAPALSPHWFTEKWPNDMYHALGSAFCTYRDAWKSIQGRHLALADALDTALYYDQPLITEITDAFTLAEAARMPKPKGPARVPKTAKPKAKRSRKSTLERIADALEILANPLYEVKLVEGVHPVDISTPPAELAE